MNILQSSISTYVELFLASNTLLKMSASHWCCTVLQACSHALYFCFRNSRASVYENCRGFIDRQSTGVGEKRRHVFQALRLRSRALRSLQSTRFVRMLVDFRKEKENNVLYRLIQRLTSNSNITTITQFVWASCVARESQALSAEIPNTLVFHRNFACTSIYFEQRHI